MNPFTFKLFTNKIFRQTNKFISSQNKIQLNKIQLPTNTSYNNCNYYNFYKNYIKR